MQRPNKNQKEAFRIKQTQIKPFLTEKEISSLGKRLMKIAKEIENSDEPTFDETAIEKELEKRRGGYVKNGG
jgi:hypothetical protein